MWVSLFLVQSGLMDVGVPITSTVSVDEWGVSIAGTVSVDGCGCLYCRYSQG